MKLQSIQILRAIAALSVVVAHLQAEFASSGAAGAFPDFPLGPAGVDLFFVISGFVMVYASEHLFGRPSAPKQFIAGRIARIVPLYWMFTALFLVFVLLVQRKTMGAADMTPQSILASFGFIPLARPSGTVQPVYGVGWTLNYEMLFYVLFAAAVWLPRRRAVATVTTLIVLLIQLGPVHPTLAAWSDPLMLEFVFGMIVGLLCREGARLSVLMTGALGLAGLLLFWFGPQDGFTSTSRFIVWGGASALVVAACALSSLPASQALVARAMAFLGECSYSLYLCHMTTSSIPRRLFPSLVSPIDSPYLFAALVVAVNIGSAIAIHIWIERPMTLYLKRVPVGTTALTSPL